MSSCDPAVPGCTTCGDVAVPFTVVTLQGSEAQGVDEAGRPGQFAIDLVACAPGDVVLVHAGVAIGRLDLDAAGRTS